MQNLLKNKQRTWSDKIESRGIVYQLLARFLKRAQVKMELKDNRIEEAIQDVYKRQREGRPKKVGFKSIGIYLAASSSSLQQ